MVFPTLSTMDTFFTPNLKLETIAAAWLDRKQALHRQRLEAGRDQLLEIVKTHCATNRTHFYNELLDAANTATHPSQLRVPIWAYTAANIRCDPTIYRDEITRVQELGYDNILDLGPGNGTVRIQSIVHQTDFLQRLSAYFGPDFYVYVVKETALSGWSETWKSHTRTLVLKYNPTPKVPQTPPGTPPQQPQQYRDPPPVRRPKRQTFDDEPLQEINLDASCYCHKP